MVDNLEKCEEIFIGGTDTEEQCNKLCKKIITDFVRHAISEDLKDKTCGKEICGQNISANQRCIHYDDDYRNSSNLCIKKLCMSDNYLEKRNLPFNRIKKLVSQP